MTVVIDPDRGPASGITVAPESAASRRLRARNLCLVDAAPGGTALLVDDADVIAGRLPAEYTAEWLARLERAAREARGRRMLVVVAAARVSGALSRTIELLPGRALLPLASRADHVAAGGESADYAGDQPPGRGRWGRRLVQFAMPDAPPAGAASMHPSTTLSRRSPTKARNGSMVMLIEASMIHSMAAANHRLGLLGMAISARVVRIAPTRK